MTEQELLSAADRMVSAGMNRHDVINILAKADASLIAAAKEYLRAKAPDGMNKRDVEAMINKSAEYLVAKGVCKTIDEAVCEVFKSAPELYREYRIHNVVKI